MKSNTKKVTTKLIAVTLTALCIGTATIIPTISNAEDSSFSLSVSAASTYYGPSLANGKRIEAYCQSTIKVYLDSSLRTAGSKDGNGRAKYYNACATNNDLIYIYSANSSSCYISYPVGSTRRYGYIRTSDLLLLNYTQNKISSKAKVDAFKQSNLKQKGGEIWVNDTVYVTGKNGSSYCVTFNISGGNWKSMWISQASYDKIRGSSINLNQNNKGTTLLNFAKTQLGKTISSYSGEGFHFRAWCADFVSYCARKTGCSYAIPTNSSVDGIRSAIKNKGGKEYSKSTIKSGKYTPKAGDVIIFKSSGASHVGIVSHYQNSRIYYIDGNNTTNGNGYKATVHSSNCSVSDSRLTCVLHPNY